MDIFLTKPHCFASEGPLLTPWICMDYFYDGWMHFLASKSGAPFTTIRKLGRARIFLNVTPIVFV